MAATNRLCAVASVRRLARLCSAQARGGHFTQVSDTFIVSVEVELNKRMLAVFATKSTAPTIKNRLTTLTGRQCKRLVERMAQQVVWDKVLSHPVDGKILWQ